MKERDEEVKEREQEQKRIKHERTRKEIADAFGVYTGLLGSTDAGNESIGRSKDNSKKGSGSREARGKVGKNQDRSGVRADYAEGSAAPSLPGSEDFSDAPMIKRMQVQAGDLQANIEDQMRRAQV